MDVEIMANSKEKVGTEKISINLSILPLISEGLTSGITNKINDFMGTLVIFEDISSEKEENYHVTLYGSGYSCRSVVGKRGLIMEGRILKQQYYFRI